MQLFIGSTNPVKVAAVKLAVLDLEKKLGFPISVIDVEVVSGVPAQPRTDALTEQGCIHRAKAALQLGLLSQLSSSKKEDSSHTSLGVGLEGGVYERKGEMWSTVWVCVTNSSGDIYTCNGARFKLSVILASKIRSGIEMGSAMDELAGENNLKHKQGMIGIVTKGVVDRTSEYANLARLALGLWYGRDWDQKL